MADEECPLCGWRPLPTADVLTVASAPVPMQKTALIAAPSSAPPSGGEGLRPPDHVPVAVAETPARAGHRVGRLVGGLLALAAVIAVIAFSLSGGGARTAPPTSSAGQAAGSGDGTASDNQGSGVDTPDLAGTWITVLASIEQTDAGLIRARSIADELHETYGVDVYVIDSHQYQGLNAGWWVVVLVGSDSNAQARSACSTVGRAPGGSCYGRLIKH
jgi:hypothetical protein